MIDREQAIQVVLEAGNGVFRKDAERIVDAILPDPEIDAFKVRAAEDLGRAIDRAELAEAELARLRSEKDEWRFLAEEADRDKQIAIEDRHVPFNAAYTLLEEARAELARLRPVVEAAREFAASVGWVTDEELVIKAFELRALLAALDGEPDEAPRWLKLDPDTYHGGGVMGRRAPVERKPPITDEMVERAARALCERENQRQREAHEAGLEGDHPPQDLIYDDWKDEYEAEARTALLAALDGEQR